MAVARPIPRLWVESPGGARFALTYGNDRSDAPTAIGFDRSRLDPLLLRLATNAGVRVCPGVALTGIRQASHRGWVLRVRDRSGERCRIAQPLCSFERGARVREGSVHIGLREVVDAPQSEREGKRDAPNARRDDRGVQREGSFAKLITGRMVIPRPVRLVA